MRSVVAFIIIAVLSSLASAGVTGRVDAVGFGSYVRPDCWVPLRVQLDSDSSAFEEYELQVVQYDLNGDEVVYTRPVGVNPGRDTRWVYFKPQSINGGLPAMGTPTAFEIDRRIRVYLADPTSKKRLSQISIKGQTPQALELGAMTSLSPTRRVTAGQKLVVIVGRSPRMIEFSPQNDAVLGLNEYLLPAVMSDAKLLPDSVAGYEMVDAVVWTDLSPQDLSPPQFRAVLQYVRGGGHLVVIQNSEAARMSGLNELLPVDVAKIEDWNTTRPLKGILQPPLSPQPLDRMSREIDVFEGVAGPFRMARATARPDALVERWVHWSPTDKTPYIARRLYGLGSVTWMAQDISDPVLAQVTFGWPRLWNELLGLRDMRLEFPQTAGTKAATDRMFERSATATFRNVGAAFIGGLNLESKTAALISVAFIFFIGYWLIAGPGSYLLLVARKQTQWSWFLYGAIALVAVVLTVGITRLVLRGSAQVRHVTLVRESSDPATPTRVLSRMGIYLPEDRTADPAVVAVTGRDRDAVSTLTPLAQDPRYSTGEINLRDTRYRVPFLGDDADEPVELGIPFRSTLKKLQADWTGNLSGQIAGQAYLPDVRNTKIAGRLTNNSGVDLANVLMIYRHPRVSISDEDQILFRRVWGRGQTIDLSTDWDEADAQVVQMGNNGLLGIPLTGQLRRGSFRWVQTWIYENMRSQIFSEERFDDSGQLYERSFPIVSLFGRLTPMDNTPSGVDRANLLRWGVRNWDCSNAVAAGALVIIAQNSNAPLPIPLTVDGRQPTGFGQTFFQFIVPMDRSRIDQPADRAIYNEVKQDENDDKRSGGSFDLSREPFETRPPTGVKPTPKGQQ